MVKRSCEVMMFLSALPIVTCLVGCMLEDGCKDAFNLI